MRKPFVAGDFVGKAASRTGPVRNLLRPIALGGLAPLADDPAAARLWSRSQSWLPGNSGAGLRGGAGIPSLEASSHSALRRAVAAGGLRARFQAPSARLSPPARPQSPAGSREWLCGSSRLRGQPRRCRLSVWRDSDASFRACASVARRRPQFGAVPHDALRERECAGASPDFSQPKALGDRGLRWMHLAPIARRERIINSRRKYAQSFAYQDRRLSLIRRLRLWRLSPLTPSTRLRRTASADRRKRRTGRAATGKRGARRRRRRPLRQISMRDRA